MWGSGPYIVLNVVLLYLLPAATPQLISLQLEHALNGVDFTPAGHISGNLEIDEDGMLTSLALQRQGLSGAEEAAFAKLVQSDGMYLLRASSADAPHAAPLLTALPARCLATPGFQERLQLDATPAGRPLALSYAEGCQLDSRPGREWAAARPAPVTVRLPAPAPAITVPTKPYEQGQPKAAEPQAAKRPAAKEGAKEGEEAPPPPPPDTRTWLQKNWIFAVPLVMIVFNLLTAGQNGALVAQPPAQGQRRPEVLPPARALPRRRQ